jgi:UrcA family protein
MTTTTSKLTSLRSTLFVASALAMLAATSTSFAASPDTDVPSVAVRYDDLNLQTTAGVDALYHRISNAARDVCPDSHSRDLLTVTASERCQAAAVSRAVQELNNPKLAMLHASRVAHG